MIKRRKSFVWMVLVSLILYHVSSFVSFASDLEVVSIDVASTESQQSADVVDVESNMPRAEESADDGLDTDAPIAENSQILSDEESKETGDSELNAITPSNLGLDSGTSDQLAQPEASEIEKDTTGWNQLLLVQVANRLNIDLPKDANFYADQAGILDYKGTVEQNETLKAWLIANAESILANRIPAPSTEGTLMLMREGSPDPMLRKVPTTPVVELKYYDKADPANGIIIMDRNLGAKSNDITSPDSYGYYYQWGNNYGFWNGTSNGTNQDGTQEFITGTTLVDASAYGPNNPYSNKTFIIDYEGTADRASSGNDNLRGGAEDGKNNNYGREVTNPNRQGPCPAGYHVPSQGEWNKLLQLFLKNEGKIRELESRYLLDYNFQDNGFMKTFKLPPAQGRDAENGLPFSVNGFFEDEVGFYWSSSPDLDNSSNSSLDSARSFDSYYNYNGNGLIRVAVNNGGGFRSLGFPVRCFKDSYTPPQTFHLLFSGQAVSLSGQLIIAGETGTKPADPERSGYIFTGRFTDEAFTHLFSFDIPITEDTTVYAKWQPTAEMLTQLKVEAKSEIDMLSNLSNEEKETYKTQVENAIDEAGITKAVNDAKAKDVENKAKADTGSSVSAGYSGGGFSYSRPVVNEKGENGLAPEQADLSGALTPLKTEVKNQMHPGMITFATHQPLTRLDLAKLIIALDQQHIAFKKPKTVTACDFKDISHLSVADQHVAKTVCEQGVMGIHREEALDSFWPNQTLINADFVTVLSRMIFGYYYEEIEKDYWISSLTAMKTLGLSVGETPTATVSLNQAVEKLLLYREMTNIFPSLK